MNRNERDRQTNKSETHVRFNLALLLFLKEAERTSNFGKHEYYSNELSAPLSIASTRPNIPQKKYSYLSGIPFNSIWPFLFAREPFRSRWAKKLKKLIPAQIALSMASSRSTKELFHFDIDHQEPLSLFPLSFRVNVLIIDFIGQQPLLLSL